MSIFELIEEITLDQLRLETKHKNQIIDNYTTSDWARSVQLFLKGIGSRHQVPGNVVYELIDYLRQYDETKHLTRDQKWFILHTLMERFDQIDLISRTELGI
jgi:hypothetical protein